MQRHLEKLRRDEEAARASATTPAAAVDEKIEELGHELDMAEHRLDAELADDARSFAQAVEAELDGWDAWLDRLQAKAAAKTGAARTRAEETIADLRRRRLAVAESLAGVRAAVGDTWRDAKKRVVAGLDELKRKADDWKD
jgi:hypothetical protein